VEEKRKDKRSVLRQNNIEEPCDDWIPNNNYFFTNEYIQKQSFKKGFNECKKLIINYIIDFQQKKIDQICEDLIGEKI